MGQIPKSAPEFADAEVFLNLTAPAVGEGEPAAVEAEAKRVLKSDPANVPALMLEGRLLLDHGDKAGAVQRYGEALVRFPDFAPAKKSLATLFVDDPANRAKAYDLATEARKSLPEDAEVAALLGQASYDRKEFGRAVQLLQESNRKKPLDAKGLFFLGMAELQTRKVSEGREALDRSLKGGLAEPLAAEAQRALAPDEGDAK